MPRPRARRRITPVRINCTAVPRIDPNIRSKGSARASPTAAVMTVITTMSQATRP